MINEMKEASTFSDEAVQKLQGPRLRQIIKTWCLAQCFGTIVML